MEATARVYIEAYETMTGDVFVPGVGDEPAMSRIRRNLAAYLGHAAGG